ncbi:hypothetical protein Tco_1486203, partial [Tanacetum coccineum]
MRDEIRTSTNLISQLNVLIADLEASSDYEEVFDLVMELRDDRRDEQDKLSFKCEAPLCLSVVVVGCAIGNAVSGFWQVYSEVLFHILSFGRINWFSDYMDEYNH